MSDKKIEISARQMQHLLCEIAIAGSMSSADTALLDALQMIDPTEFDLDAVLLWAGDYYVAKTLITEYGANPNTCFAVHNAAYYSNHKGRREALRAMLEFGGDPNARNHHNKTPLDCAREVKSDEAVELLIKHGAKE